MQEAVESIVFDFSKTRFMDSSGIGFILGRFKTITALGGTLAIAEPSKEADRILSISGIYKLMKSYPSAEDALKNVQEVHKNER